MDDRSTQRLRCSFGIVFIAAMLAGPIRAQSTKLDLHGPPGSVAFGGQVAVLPNGNLVITDPRRPPNGAAYLYSPDLQLISTVTNITPGTGSGIPLDAVRIIVLANGNYLLANRNWNNGPVLQAGMVAWGSGTAGISGGISPQNALVGTREGEFVGSLAVEPLTNGSYVVATPAWHDGVQRVGAVTWGSGVAGVSGPITPQNSIVGSPPASSVALGATLSNGNYVVLDIGWSAGERLSVGALRWVDGNAGGVGPLTAENSLIGSTTGDFLLRRVFALSNGNYVLAVPFWDNGPQVDAGAAVWADGSKPITGTVSAANALVGGRAQNFVAYDGVTALSNGNYVVVSSDWEGATGINRGAVTWADGTIGVAGAVSASNSLIGGTDFEFVGGDPGVGIPGATALANGHYVVASPRWGGDRGAVTWADGTLGLVGEVTTANSLVGALPGDLVGRSFAPVTPLSNGNYVVNSPSFRNQNGAAVGAATWVDGRGPRTGTVTAANSLVGSGPEGPVYSTPLANGNYVVTFASWTRGPVSNAGAAAWGNGSLGSVGTISPSNALVGARENDRVGDIVIPLSDGSYLVCSSSFSTGSAGRVGAVTWGDGSRGVSGDVNQTNSLLGSAEGDQLCNGFFDYRDIRLPDGRFLIVSPQYDDGDVYDAFAFTYGDSPLTGSVDQQNSVIGSLPYGGEQGGRPGLFAVYDPGNARLVVGRPNSNVVTLMTTPRILRSGFEDPPIN